MKSEFLKLNLKDAIRGLIVAIITAILTAVLEAINNGGLMAIVDNWQGILTVAITAGIAYTLKNLLTDENDRLAGKI